MDELAFLEEWYVAQCNGDWEHQYGIKIDTLDNPGWSLVINLTGTPAEQRTLDKVKVERSENDWILYWVAEKQFKAFASPQHLGTAILAFERWLKSSN